MSTECSFLFVVLPVLIAGWRDHGSFYLYCNYIILYFNAMIWFLPWYNVSLGFSCVSFFGINIVTWHSKENSERKNSYHSSFI